MPLNIVRNDITKMHVDAIVNAANTDLRMGGGVCGAIFSAAGAEKLQAACNALSPIRTGEAVITNGFALQAKHIIHTAGPFYRDGKQGEEALLRACYANALDLALKHDCESVAFPLISSGIYGYPKDEALSVATSAIGDWLLGNDMDVSLVVFDKAAFSLSQELLGEVKAFIDENYVDERKTKYRRRQSEICCEAPAV
jgi:O-acetyl-ADP-ribose deacetylase (regulator of RNase III)